MRFPEFEGEWEKKRLGEVAEIVNEKISSSDLSQSNYISTENIMQDFHNAISLASSIPLNINVTSFHVNDVLFSNIRPYLRKTWLANINGGCSADVFVFRSKDICHSSFLYYAIANEGFVNYVMNGAKGVKMPRGDKQQIIQYTISLPNQEEQNKIASLLTLIDKRIETQRKIIEDLELLKECISTGLFNRTLYSDITSDWEIVKLSEALSVPNKIKPKFIDKDKLLTVRLHLNGVIKNESTDTLSLGATNYYIRRKGQFIFGKQNIFNGAFGIIPDELDNYLSSGDVPTLDIDTSKISGLFLLYYFSREEFYKPMENLAIGSGSKRIHEATILNLKIALPTLEEQSSISKKIFILEQKINLEKKILESIQKMKKYLLKNLFI